MHAPHESGRGREEGLLQHVVWCGTHGGLSTLVYVSGVACKDCLVPKNCVAQNAVVCHICAPHKSGRGREEGLLQHVVLRGAREGLSTLVYVRAVVRIRLVPNCAAQLRSYVTRALKGDRVTWVVRRGC